MGAASRRFVFGPCLGRGSFGEVYQASMRSPGGLETRVAIKLLRADVDLHGSAVQRLRDEGRVLARLHHPSILTVVDLLMLDGRLALITEWVDGADLAASLGEIEARPLLQVLSAVASALSAAYHARGPEGPLELVHRDVKPSNIRVDRHGQTKLLDFGVARFSASDREARTASDLVVGSVPYMAPERFIDADVHPASDVFSVGCCLYEGLSGRKFYGTSKVARISQLAMNPAEYPHFLSQRMAGLVWHPRVESLFRRLVSFEPSERPTAAEAANELEEVADLLEGPSLRSWCHKRVWSDEVGVPGSMEGRVLEDTSETGVQKIAPTPVIRHAPVVTIEEASLPTSPTFVDHVHAGPEDSTVADAALAATEVDRPARPSEVSTVIEPTTLPGTSTVLNPVAMPAPVARPEGRGIALLGAFGVVVIAILSVLAGGFVFFTMLGLSFV